MATTQGRPDGIDVCNLALAHLGLPEISDAEFYTPTTKAAIMVKRYYRPTRDALLRDHNWKHSTINVALTIAADVEIEGWDYIYEYPNAVASGTDAGAQYIRKIFTDTTAKNPAPVEYKLFHVMSVSTGGQTVIATNSEDAYAEITIMGDDEISSGSPDFPGQGVKTYDALFNMAWSYLIAASTAIVLTGDKEKLKEMERLHLIYLDRAKLADSNQGYVDTYDNRHTSAFIDAR